MVKEDIKAILSKNYTQTSATNWVRKEDLPPIRPGDVGAFPIIRKEPLIVPESKQSLFSKLKIFIFKRR